MGARGSITIADIAREAGLSVGAVSYALNNRPGVSPATRARVQRIAGELGWQPNLAAKALANSSTLTIGLVLARAPQSLAGDTFYLRFIAGLETVLEPAGWALTLQVVPGVDAELASYRKWRAQRRVDGVLLVDLVRDDPRVAALGEPGELPAVAVGEASLAGRLSSVSADHAAGMREAVRYLHALGHRRIGRISGPPEHGHTQVRDDLFRREVKALGDKPVVACSDHSGPSAAAATEVMLVGADRPTAVIYESDTMALAGRAQAVALGIRVPEDLSIIAWSDSTLCSATSPTLTSLQHDIEGYGAQAVRHLLQRIQSPDTAPANALGYVPHLIKRESTQPPVTA